jgi:hypothetical protein
MAAEQQTDAFAASATQPLTDEQRTDLRERLDLIEKAEQQVREAMKPFQRALEAIDIARDALLQDREVAGCCESCAKLLLVGEIGSRPYSDDSGIIFCEEHAPTWRDIAERIEKEPEAWEDEELLGLAKRAVAARTADGTLDEKLSEVL